MTVKGKEASFVVVSMTADSKLRKRYIEYFWDNSTTSLKKVTVKAESHQRELFVIIMLRCSSLQLMTSDRDVGREGISFL